MLTRWLQQKPLLVFPQVLASFKTSYTPLVSPDGVATSSWIRFLPLLSSQPTCHFCLLSMSLSVSSHMSIIPSYFSFCHSSLPMSASLPPLAKRHCLSSLSLCSSLLLRINLSPSSYSTLHSAPLPHLSFLLVGPSARATAPHCTAPCRASGPDGLGSVSPDGDCRRTAGRGD